MFGYLKKLMEENGVHTRHEYLSGVGYIEITTIDSVEKEKRKKEGILELKLNSDGIWELDERNKLE